MLCERLTDPRRLADRKYIAEPKLDGLRAQLHVYHGEALACFAAAALISSDTCGRPIATIMVDLFFQGLQGGVVLRRNAKTTTYVSPANFLKLFLELFDAEFHSWLRPDRSSPGDSAASAGTATATGSF